MTTKPLPHRSEKGFTLIEVLIAMIILAVGLLGLEALGIGAARATARADRQTEYAFLANQYLESAVSAIRAGEASVVLPDNSVVSLSYCGTELDGKVKVSRLVSRNSANGLYVVEVAVRDPALNEPPLLTTEASVYSQTAITLSGSACV